MLNRKQKLDMITKDRLKKHTTKKGKCLIWTGPYGERTKATRLIYNQVLGDTLCMGTSKNPNPTCGNLRCIAFDHTIYNRVSLLSMTEQDYAWEYLETKTTQPKGQDGCWIWTGRHMSKTSAPAVNWFSETLKGHDRVSVRTIAALAGTGHMEPRTRYLTTCQEFLCCNPSHVEKRDS